MVQAYILIQTEVGRAREVAATVCHIDGVIRADAVTGPYDVIVLTETRSIDELGQIIIGKIQVTAGITRTLTCPTINI